MEKEKIIEEMKKAIVSLETALNSNDFEIDDYAVAMFLKGYISGANKIGGIELPLLVEAYCEVLGYDLQEDDLEDMKKL